MMSVDTTHGGLITRRTDSWDRGTRRDTGNLRGGAGEVIVKGGDGRAQVDVIIVEDCGVTEEAGRRVPM